MLFAAYFSYMCLNYLVINSPYICYCAADTIEHHFGEIPQRKDKHGPFPQGQITNHCKCLHNIKF